MYDFYSIQSFLWASESTIMGPMRAMVCQDCVADDNDRVTVMAEMAIARDPPCHPATETAEEAESTGQGLDARRR